VEEVTVFIHVLHMHENGKRFQTRQYRTDCSGNEELIYTADVEYYSFLQAGGFKVSNTGGVTIQKGDRFEADCYYDTALSSVGSSNVTFGFGSEGEMCIGYIFYYPNQNIPDSGTCGVSACGGGLLEESALDDDSDFNRTFGIVDTCPVGDTAADNVDQLDADDDGEAEDDDSSSSPSTQPGPG
ncbi:unnamed protein product, partial [Pylaiella littoralis]